MKLYKYRDINDAWPFLDILFSKRLYLAPLDRLNNPMELKQHDARHVLEALFGAEMDGSQPISHEYTQVATMLDLIGPGDQFGSHAEFSLALLTSPYSRVCSLTTNPHSSIMWSHYANGHRGICLEIELSVGAYNETLNLADLQPVRYVINTTYAKAFSPEYLEKVLYRIDNKVQNSVDRLYFLYAKLRRLYTLKMQEWSYEQEWRLFGRAERQYYNLRKGEFLSRILLGPRVEKLHRDILRQVVPSEIPIVPTVLNDGVVMEAGDGSAS